LPSIFLGKAESFLGKAESFTLSKGILLGKAESFTLSKGILPLISLISLFLFTFGTIVFQKFQKSPNYQRTDNLKLLCIQA
jgi:hypothetical protein